MNRIESFVRSLFFRAEDAPDPEIESSMCIYEETWGKNTRKGYDIVRLEWRIEGAKFGIEIPIGRENTPDELWEKSRR